MPRRLSLPIGMAVIALAATSWLMIGLGRAGAAHPALDDFMADCAGNPQPCWNEIVPGETTIDQMHL